MDESFGKGTNDWFKTKIPWRLDMGIVIIDIDKLLEATSGLTSEKNGYKVNAVEIDQLLENTRDW